MKVKYFHAKKQTHRFRKNQKVWIRLCDGDCMYVSFKWRGSGRYVDGILDCFTDCIGEIKEIDVDEKFARRIYRQMLPLPEI